MHWIRSMFGRCGELDKLRLTFFQSRIRINSFPTSCQSDQGSINRHFRSICS